MTPSLPSAPATSVVFGECACCGKITVAPSYNPRVYCSTTCRKRARERRKYEIRRDQERTARRIIFERDGYICWICEKPTDPTSDLLHNDHPTVDHVIARSKGGSDDSINLRTAHRLCNSQRRAGDAD